MTISAPASSRVLISFCICVRSSLSWVRSIIRDHRILRSAIKAGRNHELRKAGLKVTWPRVKILQILENATGQHHLSAEDVYKTLLEAGEDVGLATVYRVLTQFESAGLVIRHNFD